MPPKKLVTKVSESESVSETTNTSTSETSTTSNEASEKSEPKAKNAPPKKTVPKKAVATKPKAKPTATKKVAPKTITQDELLEQKKDLKPVSKGQKEEEPKENGVRMFVLLFESIKSSDSQLPTQDKLSFDYPSKTPSQAAKTAFLKICKTSSSDDTGSYVFQIKEVTSSVPEDKRKVFTYSGVRTKEKAQKEGEFSFKTVVKAHKEESKEESKEEPKEESKEEPKEAKTSPKAKQPTKKAPTAKNTPEVVAKKAPVKTPVKAPVKTPVVKKAAPPKSKK